MVPRSATSSGMVSELKMYSDLRSSTSSMSVASVGQPTAMY